MQKVKDFYQSLYTKKQLNNNYSEFLDNLPKVSDASKAAMEADLTLEELQTTIVWKKRYSSLGLCQSIKF